MFLIRLEDIAPLLNATFLLNQISDDANLKISPSLFSIIASHRSPRFVAVLKIIPHRFFASYSVDRDHSSRISLHAFYSAMLDGTSCPSMTIHLLENRLILRFENSGFAPQKRHELELSPSTEDENEGKVDYGKFCSIDSEDFKHIITKLSVYDDTIRVTLTDTQVKFSVANEKIILTRKKGKCIILGRAEVAETEFLITLHPMFFFLDLINQVKRVWFFKTVDHSGSVIRVPFDVHAYLIYFPQTM